MECFKKVQMGCLRIYSDGGVVGASSKREVET